MHLQDGRRVAPFGNARSWQHLYFVVEASIAPKADRLLQAGLAVQPYFRNCRVSTGVG